MRELDDSTLRAYDAYHEVYDFETADFWERFPSALIDSFVSKLPGNRVLNLGSGPGRDAILLRNRGLNVLCLDGSHNMVLATQRLGFESVQADMREMDFPADSFDGVWAYSSLIHLPTSEARGVMKKISIMLRPEGLLFLGLIEGDTGSYVPLAASGYRRFFQYYNEDTVRDLIADSGLEILGHDVYQPHRDIYLNFLCIKK